MAFIPLLMQLAPLAGPVANAARWYMQLGMPQEEAEASSAAPVSRSHTVNLGEQIANYPRAFGRQREINTLAADVKANAVVVIVGDSGVGKTALLYEFVHQLVEKKLPGLAGAEVRYVKMKDLLETGTWKSILETFLRGDAEKIIADLIREIFQNNVVVGGSKRILVMDEYQDFLDRYPDAFQSLKEELGNQGVMIIAISMKREAVANWIQGIDGMRRRVCLFPLGEMDLTNTMAVLRGRSASLMKEVSDEVTRIRGASFSIQIEDDVIEACARFSDCLPDTSCRNPDRALKIFGSVVRIVVTKAYQDGATTARITVKDVCDMLQSNPKTLLYRSTWHQQWEEHCANAEKMQEYPRRFLPPFTPESTSDGTTDPSLSSQLNLYLRRRICAVVHPGLGKQSRALLSSVCKGYEYVCDWLEVTRHVDLQADPAAAKRAFEDALAMRAASSPQATLVIRNCPPLQLQHFFPQGTEEAVEAGASSASGSALGGSGLNPAFRSLGMQAVEAARQTAKMVGAQVVGSAASGIIDAALDGVVGGKQKGPETPPAPRSVVDTTDSWLKAVLRRASCRLIIETSPGDAAAIPANYKVELRAKTAEEILSAYGADQKPRIRSLIDLWTLANCPKHISLEDFISQASLIPVEDSGLPQGVASLLQPESRILAAYWEMIQRVSEATFKQVTANPQAQLSQTVSGDLHEHLSSPEGSFNVVERSPVLQEYCLQGIANSGGRPCYSIDVETLFGDQMTLPMARRRFEELLTDPNLAGDAILVLRNVPHPVMPFIQTLHAPHPIVCMMKEPPAKMRPLHGDEGSSSGAGTVLELASAGVAMVTGARLPTMEQFARLFGSPDTEAEILVHVNGVVLEDEERLKEWLLERVIANSARVLPATKVALRKLYTLDRFKNYKPDALCGAMQADMQSLLNNQGDVTPQAAMNGLRRTYESLVDIDLLQYTLDPAHLAWGAFGKLKMKRVAALIGQTLRLPLKIAMWGLGSTGLIQFLLGRVGGWGGALSTAYTVFKYVCRRN